MNKIDAINIQALNVPTVGASVAAYISRKGQDKCRLYHAQFWANAPRAARRMKRLLRLQSEFLRQAVENTN